VDLRPLPTWVGAHLTAELISKIAGKVKSSLYIEPFGKALPPRRLVSLVREGQSNQPTCLLGAS